MCSPFVAIRAIGHLLASPSIETAWLCCATHQSSQTMEASSEGDPLSPFDPYHSLVDLCKHYLSVDTLVVRAGENDAVSTKAQLTENEEESYRFGE